MQTYQFALIIFWFEDLVLLREVACDACLHWLSWEHAIPAVTALYLCQAHMSVHLLSNEAGSMQDSSNHISWQ